MSKRNIKRNEKIQKPSSDSFKPTHLKFNFSFITYAKNMSDNHKIKLYDRMLELSSEPFYVINNRNKRIGIEYVERNKLHIDRKIACTYENEDSHRKIKPKYAIFRIYPNDNPIIGRVIGQIIKNIFYIFYIDIGGNLYKH